MSGTSSLSQFQRYVWESLPIRREAVEREVIDDVVLVAVQLWPVEHLSHAGHDTPEERVVLGVLTNDIRRILSCVYGEERFKGYWIIGARMLTPQAVSVINQWWRRRKDNRAKINTWRRKWAVDE